MKKVEIINKSIGKLCNKCNGDGCRFCEDGLYFNNSYIIVAKNKEGQEIAFQSDFAGK